jgi:choline dehydrogenase-like flavoprotein
MIDDLRRLQDGAELEADVCVVGAGAAGIALAREFLGTETRVIMVESGGLRHSSLGGDLNEGEVTGLEPNSLTEGRERVLGGTTALWAGQCLPPQPSTFAERSWVPYSGWPIEGSALEPYLRRAERLFQIEGETYDERIWDGFGVEPPAIDRARLLHRFTVWCPQPHLGRLYRRDLAASGNVRVLLNATTTAIQAGGWFDSVCVTGAAGKSARVRARICVLCCGAVENARLLLASELGNELVGRFFLDHPNGHCAVVTSSDVPRLQDLYGLLYRGRIRYLPRLVLSAEVERAEQVLSCAAYPVFHFGEDSGIEASRRVYRAIMGRRRPERLAHELKQIAREAPRLGRVAYRRIARGRSARVAPRSITLQIHAEQAPNPDSRVTLSAQRDRFGQPLPKVDWRLTDLERRTAEVMVGAVADEFRRLDLGDVRVEPWLAGPDWSGHLTDSFHQMGTTRMGRDPKSSVVDPDGQLHGFPGLFVAGASVFPAAGFVNPTLTIASLAIRVSDQVKRLLARSH